MSILLVIFLGILFCEFCGHVIHILLHSEQVPFLSRNHMIHHLTIYGPKMSQRPDIHYVESTHGRASVLGIGMEWIFPIVVILATTVATLNMFELSPFTIFLFCSVALGWGYFLFGYMHESMHLKDFWMAKNKFLKKWYIHIRKLHDIHHLHVSSEGRMNVNYGICFFLFDRLFGSYIKKINGQNKEGIEAAYRNYSHIIDSEI